MNRFLLHLARLACERSALGPCSSLLSCRTFSKVMTRSACVSGQLRSVAASLPARITGLQRCGRSRVTVSPVMNTNPSLPSVSMHPPSSTARKSGMWRASCVGGAVRSLPIAARRAEERRRTPVARRLSTTWATAVLLCPASIPMDHALLCLSDTFRRHSYFSAQATLFGTTP